MHPHLPHRTSTTSMTFHPGDFGVARVHVCSPLSSLRTHSLEFSTPQLPMHQLQHPRSFKSPVTQVPTTVPPITQAPSTQSPTQFGQPLSLALPQCARGVPLLPAAFCCADAAAAVGDAALQLRPAVLLLREMRRGAGLRAMLQRERGGCSPRAAQASPYFGHGACGVTLGISYVYCC